MNTSKLKKLLLLATITVFSVWLHSQIKPTEINELGNLWGNTGVLQTKVKTQDEKILRGRKREQQIKPAKANFLQTE